MSVSLNKYSILAGFEFFTKQAIHVADKLTELTFQVLDGTTTSLGRLLPDLRPTSVGVVMLQTKKAGSALFETPEGDVLIEITQNKQGRYIFQATGELLEPVIFLEGKKKMSGSVWEVKVSTYLQGIVRSSSRVDYGVSDSRWKGDKFVALKEKFSAEGLLRTMAKSNEVLLKLPEEEPMTFKGPQASLKAEIVLKHFYQRRKTPIEEDQSKHWDLLNRLFVGYLYFSGYALSPWVNDHVMLPHQRAQMEEKKARAIAEDGYLDANELKEMAQHPTLRKLVIDMAESQANGGNSRLLSQLDGITFQPGGYSQTYEYGGTSYADNHVFATNKEMHSRTVCPKSGFCEEFITELAQEDLIYTQKRHGTDKVDVQKAIFKKEAEGWKLVKEEKYEEGRLLRLPDRNFASTILGYSQQLVTHTATAYLATIVTVQSSKIALISALFQLVGQTKGATAPQLIQVKVIKPDSVHSIMRRTAPIAMLYPLPDFLVEPASQLTYTINLQSQFQLSNPNQNVELSIQQANGASAPSWISMGMGAVTQISTLYLSSSNTAASNVYVAGNFAYVSMAGGGLKIVDITSLSQPVVVGTFSAVSAQNVIVKGNYAYLLDLNLASPLIKVLNVLNRASPTLVTTLSFGSFSSAIKMFSVNNYLYVLYQANAASYNFEIFSISNPTNPTKIGSLPISNPAFNSYVYVSGNNAFICFGTNCCIINVSIPSNPILITTISVNSASSVSVKGNYLFIGSLNGLYIYDITTISNPVLIKTIVIANPATSLNLDGNFIYVSCINGQNLLIIDITNVFNAKTVATIPTPGRTSSSFLSNNNIFLANMGAGLTIFNAGSRVLSGTPGVSDRGLLLLNVTAQDDLGDTVVDPISIHVGDINVTMPIPNQQVYVGNSTIFTIPAGTFEYPNATFTYSAALIGGLPLPSCINFDPSTQTFLFTPHSGDQNTYRIQVTGNDGYGGTISTTFDLIVPDRIPVLAKPLGNQTAYTGEFFEYIVSDSSFTDADGDQLVYSANMVGSNALPGWLSFDPALRRFYGTPFGRNTYQIQMNANDEYGGITSATFTVTVPSSAPILLNPVGNQLAGIGTSFSFTFNSNTFYDVDGDPLTYSTNALPTFLSFNNATRTFTGTPQVQDAGAYPITIYAENPFGEVVSATFSVSVISSLNVIPPVLVRAIPDLKFESGIPFNTTFNAGTFEDPQNRTLTYTATLEGGAALPSGLYFNTNTLTLSGVVPIPQTLRISIKATNFYGAFAIDTFTLTVIDAAKYHPTVLNPLPDVTATVGASFFMQVPADTFQDNSGEPLTITVIQAGGQPVAEWLKWDAKTLSFSGMPGPFDTNTFSNRQLTIEVWATDSVSSVKTSFIITVLGQSFWALFIKYGFSFGSVAVSALGVWKERALIWNYLCKEKYQKQEETALVGQHYSHSFTLTETNVKEIKVLLNGKPLILQQPFPDGLIYQDNKLSGTPTGEDVGRFTVRIIDHHGYINEEFELIIKKPLAPDPEKNVGYVERTKRQLSSLGSSFPLKEKSDDERFRKRGGSLLSLHEVSTSNDTQQE